jgi:hypothetical protein
MKVSWTWLIHVGDGHSALTTLSRSDPKSTGSTVTGWTTLSFTTFCVFLPWTNVARRSPIIAYGKITRVADPTQIAAPITREFPKKRLLMADVGDLPDVAWAESLELRRLIALRL